MINVPWSVVNEKMEASDLTATQDVIATVALFPAWRGSQHSPCAEPEATNDRAIESPCLYGGKGGIRTHGTRKGTQHFQCCQFNHSCTFPYKLSKNAAARVSIVAAKPRQRDP